MDHKEKCKELKAIRKNIADSLGIDLHQRECTYQGECSGTCPKCAHEEQTLNKALLAGKVALASLAISSMALTGCGNGTKIESPADKNEANRESRNSEKKSKEPVQEISGVMPAPVEDYEGGLNETEEIDIEGDIAVYVDPEDMIVGEIESYDWPDNYTTDHIINAVLNYSHADKAEIISSYCGSEGNYITIECYQHKENDKDELVNVITVNSTTGDAVDQNYNEFHIEDY